MDDNELRDLQERVQLIEEMAGTNGWLMLADRAHATLAQRQQRLLVGSPKDYTDYVKEVAFIDGAFFVLRLPEQVRAELEAEMVFRQEAEEYEQDELPDGD